MNKIFSCLLAVVALACPAFAENITLAPGFEYEDLYVGPGMTAIDFDPDGKLYVCQKLGKVIVFEPKGHDFKDPVTLLDLKGKVDFSRECGLLGIAIDPEYAKNHFLYLFYTTPTDQRLVRYTVNPAANTADGETILLSGLPRHVDEHKSGDIHFAPKDPNSIYITVGNDTVNPDKVTEDPNAYNGKVLRVNKADGKGFADNPFADPKDLDAIKSRVWAVGLRNTFRFTFPPSGEPADTLYGSENGDQTDRFYQIKKAGNGGWGKGRDNGLINPGDPLVHVLMTHKPSMTGIAIAEKGPFASPDGKPMLYEAYWWPGAPFIFRGTLEGPDKDKFVINTSDPKGMFAEGVRCVNLKFGPDGALYTTNTYFADSPRNEFHLGRIKYVGPDAAAK